jgi:choline-sulfatase
MQSVYPTTCELAGLNIPESVEFPSLKNLALGKKGEIQELVYGCYQDTQRLVRSKTHKLIFYPKLKRYQLFDLIKDPYEITDQFENPVYKQVKIELMQALNHKRKELGDGLFATK